MERKIFWPNNPIYLTFNGVLTFIAFLTMLNTLKWPMLLPFPILLLLAMGLFFFIHRIVIDAENIYGPSAYGKRRVRVKIPRKEMEVFPEEGKFGFGSIVIRHKHSSKQIHIPYLYFATCTIQELKGILQALGIDNEFHG